MYLPMFWDVTRCSLIELHRRFGVTYGLSLVGRRASKTKYQYLALKTQAVYSSEMAVNFYRTIGRLISEESVLNFFMYSYT
jgi:hypothetical protein